MDFSDFDNWEIDESIPLSERVLATYDYLGIVGANWNPGEIRNLEAENAALKEENQRYRRLINRHRLGILKVDDDKGIKVT